MAIDPTTTTTIRVGQLGSAAFNSTDLVPHEVSGTLKKGTLQDLATFIGSIISVDVSVGFRAVQVNDGETLPATDQQEFILVGPGTYPNVGGGATITTTGALNALVSNGVFWFIGVEIPIEVSAIWGDINGVLSDQTDLNDILVAKADLVGGKVPNSQLPSYVDDVIEVNDFASLPSTGETGKIYVTKDTGNIYRWSGSAYIRIADESPVWGIITGTLSDQTDLQNALDGKFDVPTGDTTQYIAGDGSLVTFPVAGQAGTLVRLVLNNSGSTIAKGSVVYINGASGNKPTIAKAIATGDSTSAQTFGLVQTDITNNSSGYVVVSGDLIGLNTSAITEGTQLYLSSTTAGTYTTTKQVAPAHLVYIGVITRSHPTQGQIEVKIQNGYELDEIHDVLITSKANNDLLTYESSSSLWKNKSISTILGYTPSNDSNVVHITGSETITGLKKFTDFLSTDKAYNQKIISGGFLPDAGYANICQNDRQITFLQYNAAATAVTQFSFIYPDSNTTQFYYVPNASGTLALTSQLHNAVTLGIANGLTLSGQALSLGLASGSANGALSSTDWTTFNNKQNAITNLIDGIVLAGYIPKSTSATSGLTTLGDSAIYDNSGKIGIGTTSPSAKLNVLGNIHLGSYSDTSINTYEIRTNKALFSIASDGVTNGNGTLITYSWANGGGGPLKFNNASGEVMRLSSGGNVGIGTASPNRALTIVGGNNEQIAITSTTTKCGIALNPSNTTYSPYIGATANDVIVETNGSERMRITSGGQVQISSPISDALKLTNTNSGAYNGIIVQNDASNQVVLGMGGSTVGGTNQNRGYSGTVSNIDYYLMTNNSPRLLITSGGNVGIGTTSPSTILSVEGTNQISHKYNGGGGSSAPLYIGQFDSSGNVSINNAANADLWIGTNNSRAMTIKSGGNVLIGTTANTYVSRLVLDGAVDNNTLECKHTGTGSVYNVIFVNGNGYVGDIRTNGSSTSFNTTSDYRLKQDFKSFNGLDLVSKIKVYDYAWKVDNSRMNGVIAHELQEVVPYAVTGEKDAEQMQSVDYSKLVPILVQAIQELKAEIEILKNK